MTWIVRNLWLVPALPIFAAGIGALLKRTQQRLSTTLAIGSMSASLVLALIAFAEAISQPARQVYNFHWLQFGNNWLSLGWLLDPLAAVMLVMVTFVGLLIFIYSTGYMAHDDNAGRFFCFLSLFAGAMLGVVIANSLLLLFMCWEVVGLTSYLLIGFWYHRPAAAAAAKKAFITMVRYAELVREGESTYGERYELLESTRRDVLARIDELRDTLAVLDRKISFYADAGQTTAYEAERARTAG